MSAELTPFLIAAYAVLAAVLAFVLWRLRGIFLRGIPDLSATAMGLFRIVFGLALFRALDTYLELPDGPAVGGPDRESGLWETWGWVEGLAANPGLRDTIYTATMVAVVLFTVGLFARAAFVAAAIGIIVHLNVAEEYLVGSHQWVLFPFVLAPLVLVPWGDGLSLDRVLRRRLGREAPRRPPGPHYGLAVWLPGLVLGIVWLAAAAAKLVIGGTEWVTGGAVRYHWAEDHLNAPLGLGAWVAGQEPVAILLSAAGVGIEALFFTHLLFRSQWIRAAYGVVALSLLAGFYGMQGVFWFSWWLLLLAFVPWEAIVRLVRRERPVLRREREGRRSALSPRLAAGVAGVMAVLGVQQLAISRAGVEQMPFFSYYPMYSRTWESPDAFNAGLSPTKFYRYEYLVPAPGGGWTDITGRVAELSDGFVLRDAALAELIGPEHDFRPPTPEALAQLSDAYQAKFGEPLRTVRVVTRSREFDFEEGELRPGPRFPPVTVDLDDARVVRVAT